MSEFEEILETSDDGQYRVKLVLDDYPDEPYDDGQCPLLRFDYGRYGWRAAHVMVGGRPTADDDRIEEAGARFHAAHRDGTELLEKYLRVYHGAATFRYWSSQDYTYMAYDTAAWRAYAGWDDRSEMPTTAVNLDEYRAWCEGEVYAYEVEKLETGSKVYDGDDHDDEPFEDWEHADSCSGFYGYDWAREAALEAFKSVTEQQ